MATTMIEFGSGEAVGLSEEAMPGVEYPVQLAHTPEPVLRLAGTIKTIRPGRRDLALSEQEWQDLGLPEQEANANANANADAADTAQTE